jgi:hypothetical protein
LDFPGPRPGEATAHFDGRHLVLENAVLATTWDFGSGQRGLVQVVDRLAGRTYRRQTPEAFVIRLAGGQSIPASQLQRAGKPKLTKLAARHTSVRQSGRFGGWVCTLRLVAPDCGLWLEWQVLLRDGSSYVQQRVTVHAEKEPLEVEEITLLELHAPNAQAVGEAVGLPVVVGNLFLACEHPMASNRVQDGKVVCSVPRYRPVEPARPWTATSVIGLTAEGQLRRGFLYYLERERARPYRPFVYYISWFDIAYAGRLMTEKECLERITTFGQELVVKRGVKLNAFVFDDGWDDPQTLWRFHSGFPNGFEPLQSAAAKYDAVLGTWISPWGGYGKWKAQRLEYGKKQGFETNRSGFSLAGPKYYARFRDVCLEHVRHYGVRYFKFDGIGKESPAGPGKE